MLLPTSELRGASPARSTVACDWHAFKLGNGCVSRSAAPYSHHTGNWDDIKQRRSQGATGRGLEHADADANSEEPWRFRCLFNSSVRLARF